MRTKMSSKEKELLLLFSKEIIIIQALVQDEQTIQNPIKKLFFKKTLLCFFTGGVGNLYSQYFKRFINQ